MNINLPVHPVTGLSALGFTKRGPIWPAMGGSEDSDVEAPKGPTLTYSQARNRADEVHARMEQINEIDKPTDEEDVEFRSLGEEFDSLADHMLRLERAAEMARVRTAATSITKPGQAPASRYRLERGSNSQGSRDDYDRDSIMEPDSIEDCRFRNPWDLRDLRTFGRDAGEVTGELRARALNAVEKMQGASDNVRQAAATIIERHDDKNSQLARLCLATSSPEYLRAWSKLARNAAATMTPAEQRAVEHAESVRAMSLTDSAGGYLVPFQLDPTIIMTSNGTRSDIRQVARTVVATGDVWNGVSAANVSWSWDAEATEVSDDSPTFAQPSIPNYKAQGFVPISFEALQDEQNVAQAIGELLAAGKMDLEAAAFITGTGSGQPTGIITALAAAGPPSVVPAATEDVFSLADVYALQGSLPARYRADATWLANNLIYSKIRAFDVYGGGGFWTNLNDGRPPLLMGRPAIEAEAMISSFLTTGVHANYAAIFGDFSNFVITDRVGVTVEFIPNLFGANRRPTGQRGWLAWYRTGSGVVNPGGFRMLNVASAT